MTTETPLVRKGSSLDRFLKAAAEQDWEVTIDSSKSGVAKIAAVDPSIRGADYVGMGSRRSPIFLVEAEFYSADGAYLSGNAKLYQGYSDSARETAVYGRNRKISDLLGYLRQGPKSRAEAEVRAAEVASAEAVRRADAEAKLAAAATTDEVERWKRAVAEETYQAKRNAISALESIESIAAKARAEIAERGFVDTSSSAVFYNNLVAVAEREVATLRRLRSERRRMEALFGPLPTPYAES